MWRSAGTWLASAALLVAFAGAVVSVDAYGKSRRVAGPPHEVSRAPVPVRVVERADDAYREWRARGLHGRVVVALGTRLYFVDPGPDLPLRAPDGRPIDPAEAMERALDARSFLRVAMERGIAREIRHVLPDRAYAEKASFAGGEEGVRVEERRISAPSFGSPRSLTTLDGLSADAEPVLLFVSASFFGERDAAETWRRLASAGLRTDLVVLCRSYDDPDVSAAQRDELAAFASLLGAR
jgi:hypothetical protein